MSSSFSVIAGNGELPLKVLTNIIREGHSADVIGIMGEYDRRITKYARKFSEVRFYEVEKGIDILKDYNNRDVIFVGGIKKISLINLLNPIFVKNILKINSLSDENIFSGIIRIVSGAGFRVIGFTHFYKEGVAKEGSLCGEAINESVKRDALYGMKFIKENSEFTIGQSVIVKNENLLAIETLLGTDHMIKNYKGSDVKDAVFVKCSKVTQDIRIDLPSIGKNTIKLLKKAGIRWICLEAGRSVIIGDTETIDYARRMGINICGIKSESE